MYTASLPTETLDEGCLLCQIWEGGERQAFAEQRGLKQDIGHWSSELGLSNTSLKSVSSFHIIVLTLTLDTSTQKNTHKIQKSHASLAARMTQLQIKATMLNSGQQAGVEGTDLVY